MCGIAGVIGPLKKDEALETVSRMTGTIVHRGPDDDGIWGTDGFAFGMRRLSIIDLESGAQPMWGPNGTGIVYNGEIYNYRALRADLESSGVSLRTKSDTEVIPLLYEREHLDAVRRLEGMFAICLYDPIEGAVHLIRDRIGIKPLYYGLRDGRFYFASEIKAILAGMQSKPPINRRAVHHYLTLRYVPGDDTIWEGIHKLSPGHTLTCNLKTLEFNVKRYWELGFNSEPVDPARNYVREFESLFLDSVHKQLTAADVPVGVLLSGGLDSASVSAAAIETGHRNFHTFSVAFEDGGEFSELRYARELAEHIGSRHSEIVISRGEFMDFLPEMVRFTDEPLADLASIPLYYVSRLAREKVKVVLTGEGSDEILAGYTLEQLAANVDTLKRVSGIAPKFLLKALGHLPSDKFESLGHAARSGMAGYLKSKAVHITNFWTEDEKQRLWGGDGGFDRTDDLIRSWYSAARSIQPIDQIQEVYCRSWLVEDLLMKADRMSMATSLELRVPFLEYPLVEWAERLPLEWKVGSRENGYVSKRVLREFARSRTPESIITRPKQGFPVPAYEWLKSDTGKWAESFVFGKDAALRSLLDLSQGRAALDTARNGDEIAAHKVWLLIVLEQWARVWL